MERTTPQLMNEALKTAAWRAESINGKAEKLYGAQPQNGIVDAMMGQAITGCTEPSRPSLREAVSDQLNRAMRESRRAEHLQELAYLLDKHPDIARILDLVDEVRR